jgi:hypothetical protein
MESYSNTFAKPGVMFEELKGGAALLGVVGSEASTVGSEGSSVGNMSGERGTSPERHMGSKSTRHVCKRASANVL